MGTLRPGATIIYDSPDGGNTTYGRYEGETERWLVGKNAHYQSIVDDLLEDKLWGDIHRAAKTDAGLRDLLDKAVMYYNLSKKND